MTEKTVFQTHRAQLLELTQAMATPVDAKVEETTGDEYGFDFAIERENGMTLMVSLTITTNGNEDAGNFIIRAGDERDDSIINWGPDNRTEACWAAFDDKAAWTRKLAAVKEQLPLVAEAIYHWKNPASFRM